jgi:hypothetical protein
MSRRAGLSVWIPPDAGGTCCATVWHSKGYQQGNILMAERLADRFWDWSDHGRLPVIIDASSCSPGAGTEILPYLDATRWARQFLAVLPARGRQPGFLLGRQQFGDGLQDSPRCGAVGRGGQLGYGGEGGRCRLSCPVAAEKLAGLSQSDAAAAAVQPGLDGEQRLCSQRFAYGLEDFRAPDDQFAGAGPREEHRLACLVGSPLCQGQRGLLVCPQHAQAARSGES